VASTKVPSVMNRSSWLAGLLLGPVLWGQAAGQQLDARALGATEAVLDYCAKNDPIGAAKVHARFKRLTQGASQEQLDQVRRSAEYQAARRSELDFVGKVDPRNAPHLCGGRAVAGSR